MLRKFSQLLLVMGLIFSFDSLYGEMSKKIALIDMRRVWREFQAMKDVANQLRKETLKYQKVISKEKTAITTLREIFTKKEIVLSDAEKKKKQKEINDKVEALNNHIRVINKEVQALDARLRTKVVEDVKTVVSTYGKKKKFSLILNKNEAFVLFSEKYLDITDAIMKELSEFYVS